jgi:hypothetical protein
LPVVKHLKEGSSTLNSQDQIQQIMTKSLLNWIKEQPIRKHIHKTGSHIVPQFGINKLLKVPLNAAVNTKNTIITVCN